MLFLFLIVPEGLGASLRDFHIFKPETVINAVPLSVRRSRTVVVVVIVHEAVPVFIDYDYDNDNEK
jgi:hypothetical protein